MPNETECSPKQPLSDDFVDVRTRLMKLKGTIAETRDLTSEKLATLLGPLHELKEGGYTSSAPTADNFISEMNNIINYCEEFIDEIRSQIERL